MKQKKLGTAAIRNYLKREVRESSDWSAVQGKLLSFKISNALSEEKFARQKFDKMFSYIKNRWGHHGVIMQQFNINMQQVIPDVWSSWG